MKPGVLIDSGIDHDASSGTVSPGKIVARIERFRDNSTHVCARLLIGLAMLFDGFDIIVIAATSPLLIVQWHPTPAQIALVIGAPGIGQLIGALVFPMFTERFGRVCMIGYSAGTISLMSLLCGVASSSAALTALRVVQDIGLGGELPVAATYINEVTRAHGRGRSVLFHEVVFPTGLLVFNAFGAWLVPHSGWEVVYFLGDTPLALFFALSKTAPESPRWLATHGRMAEADAVQARFEAKAKGPLLLLGDTLAFEQMSYRYPKHGMRDLFGPVCVKRTVVVTMLWATCGFIQYGLSTWLPTVYETIYHAPLQLALNLVAPASVLGVVGSLVRAMIVNKAGRKFMMVVSFVLCGLALGLAGLLHEQSLYVVAGLCSLVLGSMVRGFITACVHTPELYPANVRVISCDMGGAWLKIAAIFSPMPIGSTIGSGNVSNAFLLLALVPILAAVTIHFLGIEIKGKVPEQLEL